MKKTLVRLVVLASTIGALTFVGGCSKNQRKNTVVGTLVGAGLGAGVGGLIGNSLGSTATGVAVGAVAGGATGAAIGYSAADDEDSCCKGKSHCGRGGRMRGKGKWRNCSSHAKDACCSVKATDAVTVEDIEATDPMLD